MEVLLNGWKCGGENEFNMVQFDLMSISEGIRKIVKKAKSNGCFLFGSYSCKYIELHHRNTFIRKAFAII